MKALSIAAAIGVLSASVASANDFKFTVTNMMDEGNMMAPLVILDAAAANATLFDGLKLSEDFKGVAVDGDPRPMNGKMPEAVAGLVFGTAGPPGVLLDGGETGEADMIVLNPTIRFFAKDESGEDTLISGVYDLSMGPGEIMLHSYDTGISEGTNEITVHRENVVKVVITPN